MYYFYFILLYQFILTKLQTVQVSRTDGNLYSLANSHISAASGTEFCHLSELFPEEYICCNSYPLHGKDGVY